MKDRTNQKRKFYKDFMERKRPKVPPCICKNEFYSKLGIVSPSLYLNVFLGVRGEKAAKELAEYENSRMRYMCYKRQLKKREWKILYKELRKRGFSYGSDDT